MYVTVVLRFHGQHNQYFGKNKRFEHNPVGGYLKRPPFFTGGHEKISWATTTFQNWELKLNRRSVKGAVIVSKRGTKKGGKRRPNSKTDEMRQRLLVKSNSYIRMKDGSIKLALDSKLLSK